MKRSPRRLLFAFAALASLGLACEVTDATRCEDMDATLRARALQLPRACNDDADCVLVELRPGYTVAANAAPDDPELLDLQRRRVELCGADDADGVVYQASCEARQCTARKTGVIQDPDAGNNNDTGPCACESDDACPFGSVCAECACDPRCLDACTLLDTCGQLTPQIGLGTDLEGCVDLCVSSFEISSDIAACISAASCDTSLDCL